MNNLRPTLPARQGYQYTNIAYSVTAQIVATLSGQPFHRFITDRIFRPLALQSTSIGPAVHPANLVSPAVPMKDGTFQDIGYTAHATSEDNMCAPAGGILSTPADLARWISYLSRLSENKLEKDDPVIIKHETLKAILKPRVQIDELFYYGMAGSDEGGIFPELTKSYYGLGITRFQYR